MDFAGLAENGSPPVERRRQILASVHPGNNPNLAANRNLLPMNTKIGAGDPILYQNQESWRGF
jgi:hypothetical protein